MNTALRIIDLGLVRPLSLLGLNEPALSIFDKMDASSISLRQLKRVVKLAKDARDEARRDRYIQLAIDRFPSNSFGYIEYAWRQMEVGRLEQAQAALRKAPKSKDVTSALAKIKKLAAAPGGVKGSDNQVGGADANNNPEADTIEAMAELSRIENGVLNADRVEEIANAAKKAVRGNVTNWSNYELLTRAWLLLKRNSSAIRLLKGLSQLVNRGISYEFLLADAYVAERNYAAALSVLLAAQARFPRERRILFRIADLYRNDGQVAIAHVFMKAAQACYPVYGTVRCLTFEADHKLLGSACASLEQVSAFEPAELLKFMPMINRVSVFFPEHDQKIAILREKARKELWASPFLSSAHLNEKLKIAIKSRWVSDARKLIDGAADRNVVVEPVLIEWFNGIVDSLGEMAELVEIAYVNEQGNEILGLVDGVPVPLHPDQIDSKNTVELFIPTAFFADREDEKPSYQTVRAFLGAVYTELLSRPELIIVPRHQYNWRHCRRRLSGKTVSYHTNAPFDRSWLHVQEAPLAGRCSVDHQGFAGYSSLASDFSAIVKHTEPLTPAELERNHQEMYKKYVTGNVSKYEQPEQRTKISGKYVFVALQIPTDIVADLAAIKGVDMLKAVADFYHETDVKVIVKRHPYCNSMTVQTTLEKLIVDGKVKDSSASVHDLIEGAQTVFTVNSGVGLEALMHLKPVVVTGDCDYRYGVAAAPRDLKELESVLQSGVRADNEKILRLLHYYNTRYAIDVGDRDAIKSRLDAWLAN